MRELVGDYVVGQCNANYDEAGPVEYFQKILLILNRLQIHPLLSHHATCILLYAGQGVYVTVVFSDVQVKVIMYLMWISNVICGLFYLF